MKKSYEQSIVDNICTMPPVVDKRTFFQQKKDIFGHAF